MSAPQRVSITLAAPNAAAVASAQTPAQAGALVLTAQPVTLDAPRRVLVTTAANETGKALTLAGTDRYGLPISEVVALPNAGTAYTMQDFATVTSAVISAAAAGAISVGTNGVASTRWIPLNYLVAVFNGGIQVNFGGVTAVVTMEGTMDPVDPVIWGTTYPGVPFVPPTPIALQGMQDQATDFLGDLSLPSRAIRLTVLSGANQPGVRVTFTPGGV